MVPITRAEPAEGDVPQPEVVDQGVQIPRKVRQPGLESRPPRFRVGAIRSGYRSILPGMSWDLAAS